MKSKSKSEPITLLDVSKKVDTVVKTVATVIKTVDDLTRFIQNNVAMKDDLKQFATKKDLLESEIRVTDRVSKELQRSEERMLEEILGHETMESVVTKNIDQRVRKLEKHVFHKNA